MSATSSTTTKAKAEGKALPAQTEQGKVRAAIIGAKTEAEWLHAAGIAAAFYAATDRSSYEAKVLAAQSIGESLFGAFGAKAKATDANTVAKPAAEVPFSTLMASLFGLTKADYEAKAKAERPGPGKRSWTALTEDYAMFVHTSDGLYAAAYDEDSAATDSVPTVRGYLSFAKAAAARGVEDEALSAQAKGAKTKAERAAFAKAEAERAATARKLAEDKRTEAKTEAEDKAKREAEAVRTHVASHPAGNVVEGIGLSIAEAMSVDITKLRALAAALLVIAEDREAAATKAKAEADAKAKAEAKATPQVGDIVAAGQAAAAAKLSTEDEAEALGAEAEAKVPAGPTLAEVTAELAALAALVGQMSPAA